MMLLGPQISNMPFKSHVIVLLSFLQGSEFALNLNRELTSVFHASL